MQYVQGQAGDSVSKQHVLGVVEAVLGADARDKIHRMLDSGMSVEQIQQGRKFFSGRGSSTGVSKDALLRATEEAHGEGVRVQPEGEGTAQRGMAAYAKEKTEGEETNQ